MLIIGCDFHPGFQQVAIFDNLSGEIVEKRLQHREAADDSLFSLLHTLPARSRIRGWSGGNWTAKLRLFQLLDPPRQELPLRFLLS